MKQDSKESVGIRWSKQHTDYSAAPMLKKNWGFFRCALVGTFVYVTLEDTALDPLYVLDLGKMAWRQIRIRGDRMSCNKAGTLVLVGDALFVIDVGKTAARLRHVQRVDLLLEECMQLRIQGKDLTLAGYHVSDYWERSGVVLINTRVELKKPWQRYNSTYALDVKSLLVRKLTEKGKPPSFRDFHSSYFLETTEKWLICGGAGRVSQGLCNDLCILDCKTRIPTWTTVQLLQKPNCFSAASLAVAGEYLLIIGGVRLGLSPSQLVTSNLRTGKTSSENAPSSGCAPTHQQYEFGEFLRFAGAKDRDLLFISATRHGCRCFNATVNFI